MAYINMKTNSRHLLEEQLHLKRTGRSVQWGNDLRAAEKGKTAFSKNLFATFTLQQWREEIDRPKRARFQKAITMGQLKDIPYEIRRQMQSTDFTVWPTHLTDGVFMAAYHGQLSFIPTCITDQKDMFELSLFLRMKQLLERLNNPSNKDPINDIKTLRRLIEAKNWTDREKLLLGFYNDNRPLIQSLAKFQIDVFFEQQVSILKHNLHKKGKGSKFNL
jgi:hypothetical protein